MDSCVLSTTKKIELINAIQRHHINKTELNTIIQFLIKNKKEIEGVSSKYVDDVKKEYNKYLNKKIPELKRRVSMLKVETDEILLKQREWNPGNLLDIID